MDFAAGFGEEYADRVMSAVFRFFPTIGEEDADISEAMRMRGIRFGGKHPGKMLGYRLIPLMISIVKIGDALSAALTRGLAAPGAAAERQDRLCHHPRPGADVRVPRRRHPAGSGECGGVLSHGRGGAGEDPGIFPDRLSLPLRAGSPLPEGSGLFTRGREEVRFFSGSGGIRPRPGTRGGPSGIRPGRRRWCSRTCSRWRRWWCAPAGRG